MYPTRYAGSDGGCVSRVMPIRPHNLPTCSSIRTSTRIAWAAFGVNCELPAGVVGAILAPDLASEDIHERSPVQVVPPRLSVRARRGCGGGSAWWLRHRRR